MAKMREQDLQGFEPDRILIIQLRQMGDVLLTTPAVRALRKRYPESHIAYLVEDVPGQVLQGNRNINELMIRDDKSGWKESIETLARVRRGRFDLVVDFLANPRTALITSLSRATVSISYLNHRRHFAYTHPVMPQGTYSAAHKLSLLRVLGCPMDSLELDMELPESAQAFARKFMSQHGLSHSRPIVCLYPFHKRPVREWPPEYFMSLADRIKREWDAAVIILWGPGREGEAESFLDRATENHFLVPPMDIFELAAFCREADLFVGNDGGPRHIAASQNTPTFIILGPSDEAWTPPAEIHTTVAKDIPCRPCNLRYCPEKHHACMRELKPEFVFSRLSEFWQLLQKRKQGDAGQ
jgi:ADP-heptose:LPS heptosyltransferase